MLELNPLFTDGCVLCRGREIAVFGRAVPGKAVTVRLLDASGAVTGETSCRAEADGGFLAWLPPAEAGTGLCLELESGEERLTVRDVAVGEVFLAGGQSNMELALCNADGGPEEIAAHDDSLLRFFDVPKWARPCPEADEAFASARWQHMTPGNAPWISAVAYWYGRKLRAWLRREAGDVPVGIIDCWWGGTSVTCWMDEETLRSTEAGRRYLDEWAEKSDGVTMEAYLEAERRFMADLDAWNARVAEVKRELGADAPWAEIEKRAGVCPWYPPYGPGSQYRPAGLYRCMLERIMPVTVTAFLWYQGEEDTCRTDRYDLLMGQLIGLWRERFGGDAERPFLFVQLPGWGGAGDHEAWPRLRLQQQRVADALRGVRLAVTLDLGDRENIHPTDKRPVGERLFGQALAAVYGRAAEEGPRAAALRHLPGAVRVTLTAPIARGSRTDGLFELAGADGVWHPAEVSADGRELTLCSETVPNPRRARYGFFDWPETVLRGENGLPLAPFDLN
ncbi:MAG: hypothetical protein IKS31_12420 [Clostridia bacterium]|nr:hypothetical protein [Clostridia bacterium]